MRKPKSRTKSKAEKAEVLTEAALVTDAEIVTEAAMVKDAAYDARSTERAAVDIKAVIQMKSEADGPYKEITKLSSVSRSGCSFEIARPCETGRLVTLVSPMPKEFRAYDHDENLYPVIGLVQNCYEVKGRESSTYRIGVAFVGKHFPKSYDGDPLQHYHICGTSESGMWKITESGKTFQVRSAPRFWIDTQVALTWVQKERRIFDKENTITINVSTTGASVVSTLGVNVGDKIKFANKQHDFYSIAIVRNRRERRGQPPVIHLEFVDRRFPVEKLPVPQVTGVTDQDRSLELIETEASELALA